MADKYKIVKTITVEEEVGYDEYLAQKIMLLRKKRGLTQEEFSELVGLSRASVNNIEKNRQAVSMSNLHKICSIFNVKSRDLLPF